MRPGEFQRITAGTGVKSQRVQPLARTAPAHFYQIWLTPEREGLEPGYAQAAFDPAGRSGPVATRGVAGRARRVALHPAGRDHLAGRTYRTAGRVRHEFAPGRAGWLQVLRGHATANGVALAAGDGVAIEGEGVELVGAGGGAEVMLFDLA